MADPRLRPARRALAFAFFTQGVAFALLVTRIPAVQHRYGISDTLLPAFLAGVPVLAGAGSLTAGALAARVPAGTVLRCTQPVVLLALVAAGAGRQTWQLALALGVFGLAVGALDASMNMRGVAVQQAYGRSIMLVRDALGGSEALATVPYGVYTVMTLLGRGVGDPAVRRFGPVAVVRGGTVLAACGFGVVAAAPGPWTGLAGFGLLGLGLSVVVPQVFAAAGRLAPGAAADAAVARLNVFTYVGVLVGAPLVGVLGELWHPRGAMLVPLVLLLLALRHAPSFGGRGDRYGGRYERSRAVDVG
ncbi:MFS transporter [Streptomyces sp. CC228A]|uniref:MFS transporter n=1 Tax=Streptomyces sp. CC228A TaxID=2898186 RepID=UPI001F407902|nr:MFS transporter [Streptomyces sp. CC228A]